ncbi:Rieske (2Fe-2S) protein [Vulgatibacter sp.]|uniref:Rieske (2Fe-2S) protein n=1 Tax=Vulgatibacter sp. TaxID=1971226 RepID=UPI00356344A7
MERTAIASSAQLPEGGAIRFRASSGGAAVDAFVIRFRGALHAYVNRCTHREVELDLGNGSFFHPDGTRLLCRAHGALYEPGTGACAGGMCPKGSALTPVAVEEIDGVIYALPG